MRFWDAAAYSLMAQMVRTFDMNPKVGGSSPPQIETFSFSKTLTLSQEHPFVSKMNAVARAQLTFQRLTSNLSVPSEPVFKKHLAANGWPSWLKWLEHSAWIRRLGVRVPLRSRPFLSQKRWHFHENIRSCAENEWCLPRAVNISNVNFTSKISIPPEPVFKNMGQ